jgi:hypothetical protein
VKEIAMNNVMAMTALAASLLVSTAAIAAPANSLQPTSGLTLKGSGGGHGGGGDRGGGVHHFVGSMRDDGFHGRRMGGDFSRQPVWR